MKIFQGSDIDLLITDLYRKPHQYIVIDGEDGIGKSTIIAPRIANVLGASVIHLDDYLVSPSDSYQLHSETLAENIAKQPKNKSVIIEGVMALKSLNDIHLTPSIHIYAESPDCRKTWTGTNVIYQGTDLAAILNHEEQEHRRIDPASRLTVFRKEVIEYHYHYRPFEKADYKLVIA